MISVDLLTTTKRKLKYVQHDYVPLKENNHLTLSTAETQGTNTSKTIN